MRHYEAKAASFFFKDMIPISAETSGGVHIYRVNNVEKLKVYYRETTRYEGESHAWTFGTWLTNLDVTYANLWRHRSVYQKEAILVFGEHYNELSEADKQQRAQGFNPGHEKFERSPGSCGFQYLNLSRSLPQPDGDRAGPRAVCGG